MAECRACSCPTVASSRNGAGNISSRSFEELAAIAGSLVASNCCVLQLVLNSLSLGCAGFAALDPYKGVGRALAVMCVGRLLLKAVRQRERRAGAFAAISLLLLASQDVLAWTNRNPTPASSSSVSWWWRSWHATASPMSQHGQNAGAHFVVYCFEVQGMKCEGCAARVKAALLEVEGIEEVSIDFPNRKVLLTVAKGSPMAGVEQLEHQIRALDLTYDPVFLPATS
uniref:HMA domain-containing protein n=1 Tax=Chlamydomonas euryale TaxID=1486919 RepID=A0A7R9YST7_9CHLO|mmetsp:Transcript_21451/g.64368  ORF Transcript_21451/g.64368 Transcript_21451/m.64368 type:complete len:227 (+) Transcript_21451:123-803(+)|eukprot:355237-Chlamydomonas_euryale.AAC.16